MKKLLIFTVLALSVFFIATVPVWSVDIGPAELPSWHSEAQVQLGWIFDDPLNPQDSTPLTGWDTAIGDIPVWNYDKTREAWGNPGQWYIKIPNLVNENPVKYFWVSWVYSYDPLVQGPLNFTNLSWTPFTDYANVTQTNDLFDSSGNQTTNPFDAAYARFTISYDLYPNPNYEELWLGTKPPVPFDDPNMKIREVYIKTLCVPACEGDFESDGDVDGLDLSVFATDFGRMDCDMGELCEGNFDGDQDVDGLDLTVFAADFGRTDCPIIEE